ncbi:MAG: hypothetical protein ABI321_23055 [Polyangia bacterium]
MRRLLFFIALMAACNRSIVSLTDAATSPTSQLTDVAFEELYTVFLAGRATPTGDKAGLWTGYRGRWVHWEGVLASFTDNGVTLKQLRTTSTFDVSLLCESRVSQRLKERFAVGDRVRYTGRLDSFDDIFRTLYLTHGAVLEKVAQGDLGVPYDMTRGGVRQDRP